jgi:thioesterase domain-containing protein
MNPSTYTAIDTRPGFDKVPLPIYAFPARAWHRDEYASLAASPAGVALAVVHETDAAEWARCSIEDLAEHYAGLIREREQGRRSVALLGWSVGGLVAMEVARRLAGEVEVAWIGLVDASGFSGLRQQLLSLPPLPVAERQELEQVVSRWLGKSSMRALWEASLQAMGPGQHDLFLREVVASYGNALPTDGPSPTSEEHALWSRLNCLRLGLAWEAPAQAPTRLYRWQSAESANDVDPPIASIKTTTGDPEPVVIPATDHLSVLGSPDWHRLVLGALQRAGRA